MTTIIQNPDRRLRQTAVPVPPDKIGSPEFKKALVAMSRLLAAEPDGIALAAPQIGLDWRLFIVSAKAAAAGKELVFVNPEIIRSSRKKIPREEGCLSVRWLYGLTRRAEKVTVAALDASGRKFTRHASGFLAQICQHEIDHLNGILFIDHAKDIRKIEPPAAPIAA